MNGDYSVTMLHIVFPTTIKTKAFAMGEQNGDQKLQRIKNKRINYMAVQRYEFCFFSDKSNNWQRKAGTE